eukprot:TRINITY_DN836_c1_g1_i1.p1 TRINITY_DN836_c1_g1~~TRINITY_DN836_c1_g1_i1.p1  ORF type:complete len:154 (+),score=44.30 TRINITY_DN836_c1_g1_i1:218-679(+)
MSLHPGILWAQRTDKIYLTVELPDAKDPKIKLEPEGKLSFAAKAGTSLYEANLEFFDKIKVDESKISVGQRNIIMVIMKDSPGYWDRLVKGEGKAPPFLKVDWNKWADEDEEQESSNYDKFDLGAMEDFSKFGGAGNEEADSDDDDELPELEK